MIIGPNCGSRTPPITISRPGGIISSTSQPSTFAAAIFGFAAIVSMARRTAARIRRLKRDAAGIRLVQDVAARRP